MSTEPTNLATKRLAGRLYRSSGEPYCCSTPFDMTAMRSAMPIASTWSCVTYTIVWPRSCWMRFSSARMYERNAASRFENGSSSRKIAGFTIMLRPSATFCMSLTLSRPARRSSASRRPTMPATRRTSASRSALPGRCALGRARSPKARFSYTVMCVKIA